MPIPARAIKSSKIRFYKERWISFIVVHMLFQIEDIVVSYIGIGLVMIAISIIALQAYVKQKARFMLDFCLSWMFFGAFVITLGIVAVTEVLLLFQIAYAVFLPANIIFWIAFIDESMHEGIGLKKTIISFILCTVLATVMFVVPWQQVPSALLGSPFSLGDWDWLFLQLTNAVLSITGIGYAYWAITTFRKAPPILKKISTVVLVFGIMAVFAVVLQFTADPTLLMIQSLLVIVMIIGIVIAIRREPRIAHILPYTVYRLLVTSKNGPKYYAKTWATIDLDDDMLAGLMSAIRTTVKGTVGKAIDSGAISEVRMTKAIMLTEMRYECVNIVLLTSKASTSLKKSLDKFGEEFTKTFYHELYTSEGFPKEVTSMESVFTPSVMEPLIARHFGIVPSFDEMIDDPIKSAIAKVEAGTAAVEKAAAGAPAG